MVLSAQLKWFWLLCRVLGSFHVQRRSSTLFNKIISIEENDEAEGEFQSRLYILPKGSCFLMVS
jgi:hypothetical protein